MLYEINIKIDGLQKELDEKPFLVCQFKGEQAISQPFRYELDVLAEERVDASLLDCPIRIELYLHHHTSKDAKRKLARVIKGYVSECSVLPTDGVAGKSWKDRHKTILEWHKYHLVVTPEPGSFYSKTQRNVWNTVTAVNVIKEIYEEHESDEPDFLLETKFYLKKQIPVAKHFTQQQVSDQKFINNLCYDYGLCSHVTPLGQRIFWDDPGFLPKQGEKKFEARQFSNILKKAN